MNVTPAPDRARMTTMGRPSAADSQRKREAIITAARDLFVEHGYRAVSMQRVADQAQVSTRTLYKCYADKLSLFAASLDIGAVQFPRLEIGTSESPANVLRRYAVSLVDLLSSDASLRICILVYREGPEFPELIQAAEENQYTHLVKPLAAYLRAMRLGGPDAEERARLFHAMVLQQWQRAITFGYPLPDAGTTERHATLVTHIFLDGASE
jgi:AcrR family transcriptional regulator